MIQGHPVLKGPPTCSRLRHDNPCAPHKLPLFSWQRALLRLLLAIFLGLALTGCEGGHRPEKPYRFPDELVSVLQDADHSCTTAVKTNSGLAVADEQLNEHLPFALAAITEPADSYSLEPVTDVTIDVSQWSIHYFSQEVEYEYEVPENAADYAMGGVPSLLGKWLLRVNETSIQAQEVNLVRSYVCRSGNADFRSTFDSSDASVSRYEVKATVEDKAATVRASRTQFSTSWSGSYCVDGNCVDFESDRLPFAYGSTHDLDDGLVEPAKRLMVHVADLNE